MRPSYPVSAVRRSVSFGWIVLSILTACGDVRVRQPPPEHPVSESDAWSRVRADVVRAHRCYRGWREYCVDDPATVDGVIQLVLDRHFDGTMPARDRDVDEVLQLAAVSWTRYQRKDGLRVVEDKIRDQYHDPTVDLVPGKGVSVRVGMPPGELVVLGDPARPDAPLGLKSALVDRGELATREIASLLRRYVEAYPDQPAIRLHLTVPGRGATVRKMDVRYYRDLDRVVIADLDEADRGWVSRPLGGDLDPFVEGRDSLHTSDLRACPLTPSGRPRCEGGLPSPGAALPD